MCTVLIVSFVYINTADESDLINNDIRQYFLKDSNINL